MTGRELAEKRMDLGLSQEIFSKELKISRTYLAKNESLKDELIPHQLEFKVEKLLASRVGLVATEPGIEYKKAKAGLSHVSNHNAKIRSLIAGALDQFPDGNYDLYQVEGNSMLPSLAQGDRLLCRMTSVDDIIDNRIYVILVNKPELNEYRASGIWVKRLLHRKNNGYITCKSDNKDSAEPFPTFRLNTNEILEIWYPVMKMTFNMSDPNRDIYDKLDELEGRIEMLEDTAVK